jgi:hypothetical protein
MESLQPWEQATAVQQEEATREQQVAVKQEKIKTHSNPDRKGEFFDRILGPVRKFFDDSED